MKKSTPLFLAILLAPSVVSAQLIVDDNWADADRAMTEGPDPLDANWWSSSSASGNSVEVTAGSMGLVSGPSGRGLHGTFAPQTLAVDDKLVATCTFTTPATLGSNKSTAFKISMMDLSDPGLAADLLSNSDNPQSLYFDLPGYMVDFDVNKDDSTENITIRKHTTPNSTGRFMGTTGEWDSLGGSPDDTGGYKFMAETEYVFVMSLTRTGEDSMDITATLTQDGTILQTHTTTDVTAIANNIGMLGIWVNSNTFGSTPDDDPDNGLTFSKITVELNPQPEVETRIASIDYDEVAATVTIQFTGGEPLATYFVFASNDLQTWDIEVGDITLEEGETTGSVTEIMVPPGRRFYRVEPFVEPEA